MRGELPGPLGRVGRLERPLVGELALTGCRMVPCSFSRVPHEARSAGVEQPALVVAEPARDDLGEQRVAERDRAVDDVEQTRRHECRGVGQLRRVERPADHREQSERRARLGSERAQAGGERQLQALGRLARGRQLLQEQWIAAGASRHAVDERGCEIRSEPSDQCGSVALLEWLELKQLEAGGGERIRQRHRFGAELAHCCDETRLADEERNRRVCLRVRPLEIVEEEGRTSQRLNELPCHERGVGAFRLVAEDAPQRQIGQPRERGERARLMELEIRIGGGGAYERRLADSGLAADDDRPAPGEEHLELPQLRLPPDEHAPILRCEQPWRNYTMRRGRSFPSVVPMSKPVPR
jgi:hypothetical protein